VNITTSAGLAALQTALTPGATVQVFGVPKADGSLQAYTLFYYTGTPPCPWAPLALVWTGALAPTLVA
jgi:hypothetical protein